MPSEKGLRWVVLWCVWLSAAGVARAAGTSAESLHLPFWDAADVLEPAGSKMQFFAEPLQNGGRAEGYPEMQFGCEVPRGDGSAWVYGWKLANWQGPGTRTVEVVRVVTRDGVHFSGPETVWSLANKAWQGFVNIVRRPTDGAIFLFSYSAGELRVYRSDDGQKWQTLTEKAYVDHDAMCMTWYAPWSEFLSYQNTLEPFAKRYPDNIGNYRRVFSFRRSKDGVKWEWFSPPFLHGEKYWRPDDADPVDLEFYRGIVFPMQGRFAMLLQDYIAPPAEANSRRATTKHGPRSEVEWAVSRDGLDWSRPHRDMDATQHVGGLPVQGPLARDGVLRFYSPGGSIASAREGRTFGVTCRGNGEFSTVKFAMPEKGLSLNASSLYDASEGDAGRTYIMAELRDEQGKVIPGYERSRCLVANQDGEAMLLRWGGKNGCERKGQTVSVRFYLREAKIYSVGEGQ